MKTLGQLKLELMQRGVVLSPEARRKESIADGLTNENGHEEIVFSLAEDFFVRTFIQVSGKDGIGLNVHKGKTMLSLKPKDREVSIMPVPRFIRKKKKTPNPVSANIGLDGYCLNLFLRKVAKTGELNLSQQAVITVIREAFEEGVADLVQLNMDYCEDPDRGIQQLTPLIRLIKKNFRTFVALRGFAPEDNATVDRIYAAGIDLLAFPLEGFSQSGDQTPALSPKTSLHSLEYAAGVFPQGTVFTELAFGSGDLDSLSVKINHMIKNGIVPYLQLPGPGNPNPLEYERIQKGINLLVKSSQKYKLILKWLYPSGGLASPLDAPYFLESGDKARLVQKPIYKSTLGKTASEGFAALRRKLRVKDISDSYESAGL